MVPFWETKASITRHGVVVKVASVLPPLLSGLFCSENLVINKCFGCDAMRLVMLEEAAAQCDSCWGRPHKVDKSEAGTNCRGFEEVVPAANGMSS
jgi:hypothetical protein